jgi:hypothetical protein
MLIPPHIASGDMVTIRIAYEHPTVLQRENAGQYAGEGRPRETGRLDHDSGVNVTVFCLAQDPRFNLIHTAEATPPTIPAPGVSVSLYCLLFGRMTDIIG